MDDALVKHRGRQNFTPDSGEYHSPPNLGTYLLAIPIIDFFGSSLIPVSNPTLDHFALPEEMKVFLKSFGLPLEGVDGLLIHFYANAEVLVVDIHSQERFLIIGDDYGTKLGMKENTGEILSIDPNGKLPTRFVNSSILTLLAFLETYSKEQPKLAQASDEEASEIVANMKEKLRTLDARSLDDPENWWSLILEQTEQGLM